MTHAITAEQIRAIARWQENRQARVDAAASALHHLSAALVAGADMPPHLRADLSRARDGARGYLRSVIDETNPHV